MFLSNFGKYSNFAFSTIENKDSDDDFKSKVKINTDIPDELQEKIKNVLLLIR